MGVYTYTFTYMYHTCHTHTPKRRKEREKRGGEIEAWKGLLKISSKGDKT